jgi:hypothetical protein
MVSREEVWVPSGKKGGCHPGRVSTAKIFEEGGSVFWCEVGGG